MLSEFEVGPQQQEGESCSSSGDPSEHPVSVSTRASGARNGEQSAENGGERMGLWAGGRGGGCTPVTLMNEASMKGRVMSESDADSGCWFAFGGAANLRDESSDGAESSARDSVWLGVAEAAVGGTIARPGGAGGRDGAMGPDLSSRSISSAMTDVL